VCVGGDDLLEELGYVGYTDVVDLFGHMVGAMAVIAGRPPRPCGMWVVALPSVVNFSPPFAAPQCVSTKSSSSDPRGAFDGIHRYSGLMWLAVTLSRWPGPSPSLGACVHRGQTMAVTPVTGGRWARHRIWSEDEGSAQRSTSTGPSALTDDAARGSDGVDTVDEGGTP
jgi:hypothetical protein